MQVTGNNLIYNKSLSIRLCTGGFSFSIHTPQDKPSFRFIPYNVDPTISMAANLKKALAQTPETHHPYHSVQVVVDGPISYISFEQFEEENVDTIFNFSHPTEEGKKVLYNILSRTNMVVLFSIDKSVYQILTEQYNNVHFYASESPLLEHLQERSKRRETRKMYAIFLTSKMHLFIYDNGKLQFANAFSCLDINDALYFMLQAWQIQGLDQRKDELTLGGQIPARESIVAELHNYIQQVYIINPSSEFNRSEIAKDSNVTYDIQSLLLCGI